MKKYLAFLLALLMLLSACGKKTTEEEILIEEEEIILEEEPIEEPEEDPEEVIEEEPEEEPEEEVIVFTNPLTGEATETDLSDQRPYAVMLNTLKKALPQSGNSEADILIEMTEEGGITRVMALYQDLSNVTTLGTIRSTREYFAELAMGFDALLVHAGGDSAALNELSSAGYATINMLKNSSLYWRDSYRLNNVGTEHSMYTSAELLEGYTSSGAIRATHNEGYTSPFTFVEDGTPDGASATDVTVSFSGYKSTQFVYDEVTGLYSVYFFSGEAYVDEVSDTQVTVTNVIILPTTQTTKEGSTTGRQRYDLSSGTGYYVCGGQYIEINWEKGDMYDALVLTNKDGTPLELGVGKSYICIVGNSRPITFS